MDQEQVQMFINVTGASKAVAREKLQAHGGDLNAAINSFFSEVENPSPVQVQDASRGNLMEEDEPAPGHPVRPLAGTPYPVPSAPAWAPGLRSATGLGIDNFRPPFSPFRRTTPIVSAPRDVREIPIDWKDEEPIVRSYGGPVIEDITESEESHLPSQSHNNIVVDDDEVPSTASSMFRAGGEAIGRSGRGSTYFPGVHPAGNTNLNAPLINEIPAVGNNDGDDIEEEMLRAAIEASRKEAEEATRRTRPDYSESLGEAESDTPAMHTEDADYARALSLSLKTAEQEKALRERQGHIGNSAERAPFSEDYASPSENGENNNLWKRRGSSSIRSDFNNASTNISLADGSDGKGAGSNSLLSGPTEEVDKLDDEQPLLRRKSGRRLSLGVTPETEPRVPTVHEDLSHAASMDIDDLPPNAASEWNGDTLHRDEWGGLSTEEQEEAVMLEAAMFGSLPENSALRFRYPSVHGGSEALPAEDLGGRNYSRPNPQPPSPSVIAQRRLREQQDDEYLASLEADREKELRAQLEEEARRSREEEAKAAAHAEEKRREEEQIRKQLAEEELKRQTEAKKAALPGEPSIDDETAVTLMVRMPDGSRLGRRFRKSDPLQCLFDFIDVSGGVQPGSYRLVRQYPRKAFTDGDHQYSLSDLGLTSKQEALFIEQI